MADGREMVMAGLWETWKSPTSGEEVLSCTVITCGPNKAMGELHDRMPVVLDEADWPKWLGEEPATPDELYALLEPCPDEALKIWPVDNKVGDVRNTGAELITPGNAASDACYHQRLLRMEKARLIAEKAAQKGITPLEVMLANMWHFHKLAESAETALEELSADKIAGMEPDERFKYLLAEVKRAAGLRDMAHTCARDAAPYLHPRLASIEQALKGGLTVQYAISDKPLTPEEWNKQYGTA